MDLVTVRELYKNREAYLDKEVSVGGWVRSVRASKAFGFIVVSDGTYFETLQVVYHDNMANFAEISKLNVGAAIIVKGTLVATPDAKQPFEIQAVEVAVEGPSAPDYPLQKKRHTLEYLRTITHLRPRTNTFQAVFPLEDSPRMFYILVPFMLEAQDRIIRPIVGEEAFERMKAGDIGEDLAEQFATAKLCIPLYAVITAVKRMSVKILPTMIVRRFSDSFQGGRGGNIDDAATRKLLCTLEQEATDAKTELKKAVTNRRNPARHVALLPDNDPSKKYCLT